MFKGRTILITGASSGIGRAFARRFAREGARLILVARRRERLAELSRELSEQGVATNLIVEDLSTADGCERVMAAVDAAGLAVDVLVNNAGIGEYGEIADQDVAALDTMMNLNMFALVRLTRWVIPGMMARRRGHVIHVASTAAFQPTPFIGVYGATKSFVLSFSMALWYELRRKGVCVTCVCPGPVATEFFDRGGLERRKSDFLKTAMTAEAVADGAVRAAARGKATFVPGVVNRIGALGYRISPLRLITRVTAKLLRPVRGSEPA